MKKYPIRSSATKIEALDGSGALPQEILEYLKIQPPAEARLPGLVGEGIKRIAPINVLNEFLSENQNQGRQENERS